ncbi:MAG: hypothetical protein KAJ86_00795 [Alphaproteobacteria bacterium]|nr:hypothetical protein [Alphaproteobacteria bacterium]
MHNTTLDGNNGLLSQIAREHGYAVDVEEKTDSVLNIFEINFPKDKETDQQAIKNIAEKIQHLGENSLHVCSNFNGETTKIIIFLNEQFAEDFKNKITKYLGNNTEQNNIPTEPLSTYRL